MKANELILSLTVVTLLGASCPGEDWPAFRGPQRDGIVRGQSLPTQWSNEQNVAWRTELPGNGWSSPVVVGNRIYLTTAIPASLNADSNGESSAYDLALLILDLQSGEFIKTTVLFRQSPDAPSIHKKNSHASPTAIVDGEQIYVHFGHQGTACLNLNGEILWKNDELVYQPVHGNGGSPVLVDNLLIFSRDGGDSSVITALDKRTGQVAWETQRNVEASKKFSFCTPLVLAVDGREQLILPGSNVVQSLNPKTGKEYWRVNYDGYSVIPLPIYDSGLVMIATGYNTPSLLAIDPTGNGDVTETHVKWQVKTSVPHTPSLIALGGSVAMVSDKGIASGLDTITGEEIWKLRIGGNFSASPILVGSLLYLFSEQGDCTILDLASEEPSIVQKNSLGEQTLASPAAIQNTLLIRSEKALYRIAH